MSNTQSQTVTNTFTEARAREIMTKINEDFRSIALRGFTFLDENPGWLDKYKEDLLYVLLQQDLKTFQIQFKYGGKEAALQYTIVADGTIHSNRNSGGINYRDIHKDASVGITMVRNNNPKVWDELQRRGGWGTGGKLIAGSEMNKGAYSKEGFGAEIKLIGTWGK